MLRLQTTLVALISLLAGCAEDGVPCPEGFGDTVQEGCRLDTYLDDVGPDRGIFGYVKTVTGGCGPGDVGSCTVEFVGDHPIDVYAYNDVFRPEHCTVGSSSIEASPQPPFASNGAVPMLEIVTDEQGRFWAELEPGMYCVASIDPIDNAYTGKNVNVMGMTNATFDFDHGGY